jgi:hypothetical protein
MANNEEQRLMVVRAALVATTNTQGWSFIKQLANNVVQKAVQDALDEEDPDKGESKRLKAKALQAGFTELFNTIELTKNFDSQVGDQNGFGQLEDEFEALNQ